ncbi:Uma2 family endonuclease [Streptomyces sp. XD-27]|uniref:Uma2 family endonuclease n=1 Tax=Streptomyces sp. XD-27 TaxID=3062779 RepID=UPI0026F47469|nr:Uma2 family endonuclease [Streptomyces sp. XD-27]WKX72870.1 Uma2 family endonuclease [Streptomyces sp. XD-27]
MTVAMDDRIEVECHMADQAKPQELTLDYLFELLERMPVPEGYKAEIVEGAIIMSPQREVHWDIIANVYEQLRATYPRVRLLSDVRIDFPGYLNGFCPDLVALREGTQKDSKGLRAPQDIEFLLEVISRGTSANDYGSKKATYAEVGVPTYMIADPYTGRCHVFSHPKDGEYRRQLRVDFGLPIDLTNTAAGIKLSTDEFPRD